MARSTPAMNGASQDAGHRGHTRRALFSGASRSGGDAGALLAVACGQRGEPAVRPARIVTGRVTFMHYRKADEQPVIQEMVDAFVARHSGLSVQVVAQPDEFDQKLHAATHGRGAAPS